MICGSVYAYFELLVFFVKFSHVIQTHVDRVQPGITLCFAQTENLADRVTIVINGRLTLILGSLIGRTKIITSQRERKTVLFPKGIIHRETGFHTIAFKIAAAILNE